jgi:hypothetical protein
MMPERRDALERWSRFLMLVVDRKLHAAHEKFIATGDDEERKKADKAFKDAVAEGGGRWARYLKMLAGDSNVVALSKAGQRRGEG